MFFIKANGLYWDGNTFQSDYRKGIVYYSLAGAVNGLKAAKRKDKSAETEMLTRKQMQECL